jgi:hypothetical protein
VRAGRQRAAGRARRFGGHVEHGRAQRDPCRVAAHGAQHPVEEVERGGRRLRRGRVGAAGRPAGRGSGGPGVVVHRRAAQRAHRRRVDGERPRDRRGLLAAERVRPGERGAQGAGGHAEQVGELPGVDRARIFRRLEPRDERRGFLGAGGGCGRGGHRPGGWVGGREAGARRRGRAPRGRTAARPTT